MGGGGWVTKSLVLPWGMTPSYPDVELEYYKNLDEEEKRFFLGDTIVNMWNEQAAVIKIIENRFKNCLAQNYPPPEKVSKKIVKTPQGDQEWPGKPMRKLDLPRPETPPVWPPFMKVTKYNLTMTMSITGAGRPDDLALELTFT